ncbi:MAG: hypothetical protein A3F92_05450 [Candidatus Rokubacteria bacterium RIFCSPLOWO2_12_FULL_71_22]|nr:MAG: hypothetical protein A3I17_06940 [Candidatus Rokubacteria bacterium RIFCSPLOWO2_02_FULL_72_37]OGL20049.1 MAG: hypothetical protein A3F92_05450 [Candidatus Rokubacteria bacterium RIFCSPLOWO2_12_FULL_71_22]
MKWLLGITGAVVLLLIAAALVLPLLVDTPHVQGLIAESAAQALGRPVKFASLSIALLPLPAVELRRLEVADDPAFGPAPFLSLETGRLRLRLRPLLVGRVEFGELLLDRPTIALVRRADGRWNVASLGGGAPEARGPARTGRGSGGTGGLPSGAVVSTFGSRLRIERGSVTYTSRAARTAATPWRLEDLDLTVSERGSALAFEGGARLAPGALVARIRDGRLALDGRGLLEAPLSAHVSLDGKDLGGLVAAAAAPTVEVAGALRGTLAVTGTLGSPRAVGDLEVASLRLTHTNAACPEPKRRTLALEGLKVAAAWQNARFTGQPVTARLGGGTITAGITTIHDADMRVRITDLSIRALPVERVLVDFLCRGYAIAGPLDLTGTAAFAAADPRGTLSGAGRLHVGPGRIVGEQALRLADRMLRVGGAVSSLLGADAPARPAASPTEFESITGTYQIANGVVTTRDLVYTSRVMKVAVAGDYALSTGLVNLTLLVSHGRGDVKAVVSGPTASPSIRVLSSSLLRDVDPKRAESGLQELLRRFRRQ